MDDVASDLGVVGDARMIKIEFGYPQSQSDIAIIFAFQKTIGKYIELGVGVNKYTMVHVKKEGKKEIDFKEWPYSLYDILITALIEDTGTIVGEGKRNAIKDFFDKATFPSIMKSNFILVDNLLKKLAKNDILKKFFNMYFSNWTTAEAASKGKITVMTVGDVVGEGNLDPKYGFLMSSIGFMFSSEIEYKIEEDHKRFVYAINIDTLPGMSDSVPLLLIPDWFFDNSGINVSDFCKDLDINFNKTVIELKEMFSGDVSPYA